MGIKTSDYDESDVRIRPGKGTRPRTKTRPTHDDAVEGRVLSVDRGRYTVLIDAEGRVARIWRKVKVAGHAEEVLAAARAL